MPHIVILDDYHLGDPLFPQRLARELAQASVPVIAVHGSAEAGERALEAAGDLVERRDGRLRVRTVEQAQRVERATRDLNRRLVHGMNEAGVSALRIVGADRGLLVAGERHVQAGRATWLRELAEQGVVPVVAALVASSQPVLREVDPAAAAGALAAAVGGRVIVLERGGEASDGGVHARLRNSGIPVEVMPLGRAVRIVETAPKSP